MCFAYRGASFILFYKYTSKIIILQRLREEKELKLPGGLYHELHFVDDVLETVHHFRTIDYIKKILNGDKKLDDLIVK